MPPSEWPAKPPCKNGCGIGGPMMGSWFTFILTGIGKGRGTGAKPKPGGESKAAAMRSLTNFLANSSWTPQWTCCARSDRLNTMASTNVNCDDFIFVMCLMNLPFCFLSSIDRRMAPIMLAATVFPLASIALYPRTLLLWWRLLS